MADWVGLSPGADTEGGHLALLGILATLAIFEGGQKKEGGQTKSMYI